ncbi:BppU family phage baseplate upper protein [uncultured Clostridium sp.]|uniref:BppU family phage baseplate upper protein n=1 Tax=uncultured Clostridium sp. TaxID=59620 RepID=UPI00280C36B8|nr:BppU family phage baseplate upper protein [uncultured Clostridium sp.]
MARKIVINLDTNRECYEPKKCKQNDDLLFEANIFENGVKKDLTNCSIVINAVKPDKTFIIHTKDINKQGNKISVELSRDFTRLWGKTLIEIVLTENNKQNTTFTFFLEVKRSILDGIVTASTNVITMLEELTNKIQEAIKVKEDTQKVIDEGGAATKGELNALNSQMYFRDYYAPIEKYNNNLVQALRNEKGVRISNQDIILTESLTPELLNGKSILGTSKNSRIIVQGNISPFKLHGINKNTEIRNVSIIVEESNTNAIFDINTNNVTTSDILIENVYLGTKNNGDGNYTGILMYDNTDKGIYKNTFSNIQIANSKVAIHLKAENLPDGQVTPWITHNKFENIYINLFGSIGLNIEELNGGTIAVNDFDLRINQKSFVHDTRAIIVGGTENAIHYEYFEDGGFDPKGGVNYGLSIKETSVRNTIKGYNEGPFENYNYLTNNILELNGIKRVLDVSPNYVPHMNVYSNICNLIKNYNFESGVQGWVTQETTPTLAKGTNSTFRNVMKYTTTPTSTSIMRQIPFGTHFRGKYITFTVKVKSDKKVCVIIDESPSVDQQDFIVGSYHYGTNQSELLTVTKKINDGTNLTLSIMNDTPNEVANIEVEWVCLTEGVVSPVNPVKGDSHYVSRSHGIATIRTNEKNIVVNHGLDVTPSYNEIYLTPVYWGHNTSSRYWISDINETSFKINIDTAVQLNDDIVQFAWNIDSYN